MKAKGIGIIMSFQVPIREALPGISRVLNAHAILQSILKTTSILSESTKIAVGTCLHPRHNVALISNVT